MSQKQFYTDLRGLIPSIPLLQGQFILLGNFSSKITDACPLTQLAISKGLKWVDGSVIAADYLLHIYNDTDIDIEDIITIVLEDHYGITNRVTSDFIEAWDDLELEKAPNTIDLNHVIDMLEEAAL